MKPKNIFVLAALAGALGVTYASEIDGKRPIYSKDTTVYDGTNGDQFSISKPSISVGQGVWTMGMTLSGFGKTTGDDVGIIFTYTSNDITNITGMGYQLDDSGNLTLTIGGWGYGQKGGEDSPWKSTVIQNYTGQALNLFLNFNRGDITISCMLGDDESTYIANIGTLAGYCGFLSQSMETIHFAEIGTENKRDKWNVPNAAPGSFTLHNFDIYNGLLTDSQKKEYSHSPIVTNPIPEPASALLGLLGMAGVLGRRRR